MVVAEAGGGTCGLALAQHDVTRRPEEEALVWLCACGRPLIGP